MRHLVAFVGLRRNDPLYLRGTAVRRTEEKGLGYRIIGAMKLAAPFCLCSLVSASSVSWIEI